MTRYESFNLFGKFIDSMHQFFSPSHRAKRATEELLDICIYRNKMSEKKLQMLLKRGADINARDLEGKTACMRVARHGSAETLDMLIRAGADVNLKDNFDFTACMFAAVGGCDENIEVLAKNGARLDEKNKKGETACMIAAYYKHIKTVKTLAKLNANVNVRNEENSTVCAQLVALNCGDVVLEWARAGRITAIDELAFILAAEKGRIDVVNALSGIESVDIQTKNEACVVAASNGYSDTVKVLIDMGIDDAAKDKAFIRAAAGGHTDTVIVLHDSGTNVDARDDDDATACIYAAQNGHTQTVKVLIGYKADINAIGGKHWSRSACLAAARRYHFETVRVLAENGADIYARDNDGYSSIDYLKYKGPVADIVDAAEKYKRDHPDATDNGNEEKKLLVVPSNARGDERR